MKVTETHGARWPLRAMRTSLLVAVALGVNPEVAVACTCWGTQSIGNALTNADAVIVGRVRRHVEPNYSSEHPRPATVVVEVVESLTSGIKGNVEIAKTLMCYQSFSEDGFEVGKSYVFPLTRIDLANPDDSFGLRGSSDDAKVPSYTMFRLPVCSHNALLLDGQGLYTSELTSSGGRRLAYYMPLPLVKVLLPLGLLSGLRLLAYFFIAAILSAVVVVIRRRRSKAGRSV